MTAGSWILEQPVTCAMTENCSLNYTTWRNNQEVTLGDGHDLDAIGRGVVVLETQLPSGRTKKCKLHDVLYVPKLSYNLLSFSYMYELVSCSSSIKFFYDLTLCKWLMHFCTSTYCVPKSLDA